MKNSRTDQELRTDTVFNFLWPVAPRYRVIRQKGQPYLTDGVALGAKVEGKWYNPLDDGVLFRTFCETKRTEQGVLEFATRYGLLGIDQAELDGGKNRIWRGESLQDWFAEMRAMSELAELYQNIEEREEDFWETRFSIDSARVLYHGPLGHHVVASSWLRPDLFRKLKAAGVMTAAKIFLQKTLNERLQEHVTTRLLFFRKNPDDFSRLILHVVPKNLAGALWLQLARAVEGQKKYRSCEVCSRWMEISLDVTGFRSDRFTCSDACRSKKQRGKRAEARKLFRSGVPIARIAKQLQRNPETVRGWLRRNRKSRRATSGGEPM